MVDPEARKVLYEELLAYLSGASDRKDLISLYQKVETQDMAVWEIEDRMQHIPMDRVSGSPPRLKRASDYDHVVRMLLFARTDKQYAWPEHRADTPATCLMSIFMLCTFAAIVLLWFRQAFGPMVTLGVLFAAAVWAFDRHRKRHITRWQLHGDIEAWPFLKVEHYEQAARLYLDEVESDLPRAIRQ